jgi:cysteinyl-tRNA synthetase
MAHDLLGPSFDIHGGGIDLVFPHHENEAAQSRCAHPEGSFANIWMHNGFVNVEGEKMSKSLGNFFTVRDLLDKGVPGEVIRFVLLSTHYRSPMDFSDAKVQEAKSTLDYLYRKIGNVSAEGGSIEDRTLQALSNDMNTPEALRWLINEAGYVREDGQGWSAKGLKATGNMLGLLTKSADEWFRGDYQLTKMVSALLEKRAAARWSKDFEVADLIRDALQGAGVKLSDGVDGGTWELEPAQSINFANAMANRAAAEDDDDGVVYWEGQLEALSSGKIVSKENRDGKIRTLFERFCE